MAAAKVPAASPKVVTNRLLVHACRIGGQITLAMMLTACGSTSFGGSAATASSSQDVTKAATPPTATASAGPGVTTSATQSNAATTTAGVTVASTQTAGGTAVGTLSTNGATGFPLGTSSSVPAAKSPMYINTSTTLYSFDPAQNQAVRIGDFAVNGVALNNVYDLAIDGTGHLFAVTPTTLYVVDPTTAALSKLLDHGVSNANGLTCLSNGSLVIAGDGVSYVDSTTLATKVLVARGKYTSSGDIIALPDHNLYWTVTSGGPFGGNDQLLVINPTTGAVSATRNTGVAGIWGLGYASGKLYGFLSDGRILTLDQTSGQASTAGAIANPEKWTGATTNPVLW